MRKTKEENLGNSARLSPHLPSLFDQLDSCCIFNNQWYAFNTFCRMATEDVDLAPAVLRAAEVVRISKFRLGAFF